MSEHCGQCKHWIKMAPPEAKVGSRQVPVLGQPAIGECRERLHTGLVQRPDGEPDFLVGYPKVPAGYPACGQFSHIDKCNGVVT